MGGKGGKVSTQTTDTSSTASLPAWLDTASQQAVQTATDLSQRPYTPYTGQIVASTPADTQQAYSQVEAMQGMGMPQYAQDIGTYTNLLGQASPLTGGGINQLTNQLYGNYAQNVAAPTAGLLGNYLGQGPATAQQVGSNAMQLMSPYEQAVISPALQAGQQQLALANQQIAQQANNVGAFGGTRQGVQQGVAQAQTALGTQSQIANLLNQGYQANITPATNLALQQAQQGYGAAGTMANMLQQGYGTAAGQGYGAAGTNLQAGLTAAQQLPAALQSQQSAAQQQASLLQTIGAAQQQQQQAQLNAAQGQFYEQQNWPIQNLDILLGAIGAVPYGQTVTSGAGVSTPLYQNVAGSALGGAAAGAGIAGQLFPNNPYAQAAGGILGGLATGASAANPG